MLASSSLRFSEVGAFARPACRSQYGFPPKCLRLAYRSSDPLRVVGEVEDWVGHTPGQLEAMKEGIARLDAEGAANIID